MGSSRGGQARSGASRGQSDALATGSHRWRLPGRLPGRHTRPSGMPHCPPCARPHLPSPAPMSTSRLLPSRPHLAARASRIFCMPLLLMEPYSPSTPSPPPSLFCGSVWQRAVGGRAAAGGGAGVLTAQLERVLRWEGYQRALSGRHGGPAQRRWAAVGGGAAVGWAHLDGLHDAVQRPQARLGVHLAAGGCRSGRA